MRLLLLAAAATASCLAEERRETLVVTGSYEPVPLEESDRPVRSLTVSGDDALVANTVTDAINRDASVDLRQRGQNNVQTDVSIRGGTFGQTLVLLDGMRLNDAQTGHHSMDLPVPIDSLDRIEVLKGSGSTLYGSDAVGGVVHFITRAPEWSEVRLRTAVGSFGNNQQRVTASLARTRWSQQLALFRDFSTGFIPNRDYRNLGVSSITRFDKTAVTLAHADRPFGAEQYYGNFNSWERTKTWFASLRQGFGERTTASLAFRRHTDLFVLYRDRPQVFTNRHAVESWQGAFRRTEPVSANARLHWGLEALHDRIESNNLGRHSRARYAGYAALDVRALGRFSFSLGARQEAYRSGDRQLLPTAAAGVWLSPRWKLRGSVSRAFRLPSFTDLYYQDPANRGTPDLRPERALAYEGGVDWHLGERARGDITVFQRRERDGIDFVRSNPADIWRAANFQRLTFSGVEVNATAPTRAGRLEASYTALRGAREAVTGIFSRYAFNYPQHLGVAGWQRGLPAGLLARVRIGAVQRYARDAYAVVDAYVARTRGRWHPFAQVTNIGAASYQEVLGVAMPGRAVLGGVEVALGRR